MATPKSQRIGIWIIAVVMLVGTLGSFAAMVLQGDNDRAAQAEQQKMLDEYKKQMEAEQKKANELSSQYYPEFSQYKDVPAVFDKDAVGDKVTTRDLKVGTGAELTADTKYEAYYIGWNPKGKTFDSSFDGEKLKSPIDTSQAGMSLIEGWNQGVVGMKAGGVREITIPSDLAYKDKDQGDDIPPNTPLKFIIMVTVTK